MLSSTARNDHNNLYMYQVCLMRYKWRPGELIHPSLHGSSIVFKENVFDVNKKSKLNWKPRIQHYCSCKCCCSGSLWEFDTRSCLFCSLITLNPMLRLKLAWTRKMKSDKPWTWMNLPLLSKPFWIHVDLSFLPSAVGSSLKPVV